MIIDYMNREWDGGPSENAKKRDRYTEAELIDEVDEIIAQIREGGEADQIRAHLGVVQETARRREEVLRQMHQVEPEVRSHPLHGANFLPGERWTESFCDAFDAVVVALRESFRFLLNCFICPYEMTRAYFRGAYKQKIYDRVHFVAVLISVLTALVLIALFSGYLT